MRRDGAAHLSHAQPLWPAAEATRQSAAVCHAGRHSSSNSPTTTSATPTSATAKEMGMLVAQIVLVRTQLGGRQRCGWGGIQQIVVIDMANARVALGRQIGQKGETRAGRLGALERGLARLQFWRCCCRSCLATQRGLIRVAWRQYRYHFQLNAMLIGGSGRGYGHGYEGLFALATWRRLWLWLQLLCCLCCCGRCSFINAGIVCIIFSGLCIG